MGKGFFRKEVVFSEQRFSEFPMGTVIDPSDLAKRYYEEIRRKVQNYNCRLRLVGLLSQKSGPCRVYANYTRRGCASTGIGFELREVSPSEVAGEIEAINRAEGVHGAIIYYPIWGGDRDSHFRRLLSWKKDVEGLSPFWIRKLYSHEDSGKLILPCTPLAIFKLLTETGILGSSSLAGKVISVFNRSEVVGRPLAAMLVREGALVYSVDLEGVWRMEGRGVCKVSLAREVILGCSDVVITGVPSRSFPLISAGELKRGAVCINFSTIRNFASDILQKASYFIPRVGPMTIAMVMQNTLRLYENFYLQKENAR